MKLFLWVVTSPIWVPLWLLGQFFFGSTPSVMEDDPEHDASDFDEAD